MTTINVHTVSLGCPKNRVDTERMLGALGADMAAVDDPRAADLILVNTCGFIRPAVEESVSTVLELAETVRDAEHRPVLAVTGCLVSRYGNELCAELPEVDLWLSTRESAQWPALAAQALARRSFRDPAARRLSTGPAYAYLKISEGCSHRCRFCTIPSIRGPHVSRTLEEIEADARDMLAQGVPELVVVGQDVTAWGHDLGEKNGLRPLLARLLPLPGLRRLRLMYLYPAGLTNSVLDFMRQAGPPLLPYFDVPLQHAHPDVLKNMGRPFAADPRLVVERIRSRFPEAALRTSIIVGYPGETEKRFRALMDFVAEVRFTHLGVFAYQAEEGTPAAAMSSQVSARVKEERRAALMELQAGISAEHLRCYVGEEMDVLIEGPHPEWPGLSRGRAWFQAPEVDGVTFVAAPPEKTLRPGAIVRARVESSTDYDLSALV